MSKTAEQVVNDALYAANSGTITGTVLSALRSAGWLREANEIPHVVALEGYKRTVEQLTRERDEARTNAAQAVGQLDLAQRERDEARVDREAWARAYRRALATAASPEVMRVVEAAEAIGKHPACEVRNFPPLLINNLRDAVDALSASRQPKAQEPRYEARGHEVWDTLGRGPIKARKVAAFSCMDDVEGAAREFAARLNGEGGAS